VAARSGPRSTPRGNADSSGKRRAQRSRLAPQRGNVARRVGVGCLGAAGFGITGFDETFWGPDASAAGPVRWLPRLALRSRVELPAE